MITAKKWLRLRDWMARLNIIEEDLKEQFIIGSGSGGQKLHKTASCVLLIHASSNHQIKCQHSRSREANRYLARQRLCEKIDEEINQANSKRQQEISNDLLSIDYIVSIIDSTRLDLTLFFSRSQ